jgi:hypothetical protein
MHVHVRRGTSKRRRISGRGHRIRRRDDRAERERHGPRQVLDERVAGDRHGGGGRHDEHGRAQT